MGQYFESGWYGISFNLGVIVRPADYLRLGVAYNSPIWYKMTDSYWGYADTHNENYPEDPDVSGETPASPYPYTIINFVQQTSGFLVWLVLSGRQH